MLVVVPDPFGILLRTPASMLQQRTATAHSRCWTTLASSEINSHTVRACPGGLLDSHARRHTAQLPRGGLRAPGAFSNTAVKTSKSWHSCQG